MKLVTFQADGRERIGAMVADDSQVVDLQAAAVLHKGTEHPEFESMLALLDAGEAAFDVARDLTEQFDVVPESNIVRSLRDVRLLAPVPRPRSMRDCMTFERHLIQATRTIVSWKLPPLAWLDRGLEAVTGRGILKPPKVWYERPVYYKGNPFSVVGPEAEILWPSFSERLDFELEFGIFIGKGGRDIPAARAREHIAGFTLFNDFSARDTQAAEMAGRLGPAKSKDFDTANAIGPWLVTPDELPEAITLRARVNGEEWTSGSSSDMHFTFEEIIEYISRDETLHPGEFIGSGTVPGGCGLELNRWLKPGDVVELEAEGLGTLRNSIGERQIPTVRNG